MNNSEYYPSVTERTSMNTRILYAIFFLSVPITSHAEFLFMTNNEAITLNGYIGTNSDVLIPGSVNGLPVKLIQQASFIYLNNLRNIEIPDSVIEMRGGCIAYCISLTNISIGSSVTNIGGNSLGPIFGSAIASLISFNNNLLSFTVDEDNPVLSSLNGVLFDKNKSKLYGYPRGRTGNYTIPDGVKDIQYMSFYDADSLTSLTVPASVTNIESSAFSACDSLDDIYFKGNAPHTASHIFDSSAATTIYYLPGTWGWSNTFQGQPTELWYPDVSRMKVETNQIEIDVQWASGEVLVLDGGTNLVSSVWTPLATQTLIDGTSFFNDTDVSNHSARFYRLRSE